MKIETITPAGMFEPIGPYSHIAKAGPFITISGTPGVDPATSQMAGADAYSQAKQIVWNFRAMLAGVGASLNDVMHVHVFLKHVEDFQEMNRAYADCLPSTLYENRESRFTMITVYGIDEFLNSVKSEMSDVLHSCMIDILGMPEDKRAHRFVPLDKSNYYYPDGRTDKYTVIEINMMQGREIETKKALIKAIFHKFESVLGIMPIDVEITINEQPAHCWGFRGITGDEAKLNYKINV